MACRTFSLDGPLARHIRHSVAMRMPRVVDEGHNNKELGP